MILGTEGHMALGTSPKATPSTIIMHTATPMLFTEGMAKTAWTSVSSTLPMTISVAPFPMRS